MQSGLVQSWQEPSAFLGEVKKHYCSNSHGKVGNLEFPTRTCIVFTSLCHALLFLVHAAASAPLFFRVKLMHFVSRRFCPSSPHSILSAFAGTLHSEGPKGSDPEHLLIIEIDEWRNLFIRWLGDRNPSSCCEIFISFHIGPVLHGYVGFIFRARQFSVAYVHQIFVSTDRKSVV